MHMLYNGRIMSRLLKSVKGNAPTLPFFRDKDPVLFSRTSLTFEAFLHMYAILAAISDDLDRNKVERQFRKRSAVSSLQ